MEINLSLNAEEQTAFLQLIDAAVKHLTRMFKEAESEQIDGRKFHGFIELHIPFSGGNATEIRASRFDRDRVVRDGM